MLIRREKIYAPHTTIFFLGAATAPCQQKKKRNIVVKIELS